MGYQGALHTLANNNKRPPKSVFVLFLGQEEDPCLEDQGPEASVDPVCIWANTLSGLILPFYKMEASD